MIIKRSLKITVSQKINSQFKPKVGKDSPVRYLRGVGPAKEAVFNRNGVSTLKDLLYYFPFRYQDRRNFTKINQLKIGEFSIIKGRVIARNLHKIPYFVNKSKVKSIFGIILDDGSAKLECVWFNQAYLYDKIADKQELIVCGKLAQTKRGRQMVAPEYELAERSDLLNLGRIAGVYRLPAEFNQRFIRKLISEIIKLYCPQYPDPLPFHIRKQQNLPNIAKSFESIHLPASFEESDSARRRFIFEELFFSQIQVYLRKARQRSQRGVCLRLRQELLEELRRRLPFKLTLSQDKVLAQILKDLEKGFPMQRLLQGDVGCGKTVVVAFAIAVCLDSGFQTALMVPTEVLAYQHRETLSGLFKGLNFSGQNLGNSVRVMTSSLTRKEIKAIYEGLASGRIKVIIGTHSLIQEEVKFKNLGLAIIDEQHKFGVAQRALLPKKGLIPKPHCLVMSATPIPRSLALSLYGDLDLSIISELPKERKVPETIWVGEKKRRWVYEFLEKQLSQGRQAYVIYPLIEENQQDDIYSLESMYEIIVKRFKKYSVGIFHGQMPSSEKIRIVDSFRSGKIDILVSTTVVEVGVNIENASVMIVENPERFGLAQLHQLRGRIQRSIFQPHFILISKDNLSANSRRRLEIISKETDGFKIAEEDLILRGPGDFFGNLQHGLPQLKIADPLRDLEILSQARKIAYQVIKSDPHLDSLEHRPIKEEILAKK